MRILHALTVLHCNNPKIYMYVTQQQRSKHVFHSPKHTLSNDNKKAGIRLKAKDSQQTKIQQKQQQKFIWQHVS